MKNILAILVSLLLGLLAADLFGAETEKFERMTVIKTSVVEVYSDDIQHACDEALRWNQEYPRREIVVKVAPIPEFPIRASLKSSVLGTPRPPERMFDPANNQTMSKAYVEAQKFFLQYMEKAADEKHVAAAERIKEHPEKLRDNLTAIEDCIGKKEWGKLKLGERMWRLAWVHRIIEFGRRHPEVKFEFLGG